MFSVLSGALSAGYGVLFTVVGDFRDEYGISETSIGLVIGVGFLSAFVAQILIAPLADRGYARRLIVVGVLGNVVGLLLMGFGESLTPILIGRLVSGIGIGTALPAIRRIVILADPTNLGQNLGRLLSADVFGFALGPAVSAVLVGPFGLAAPFVVVAVATAACVPFTYGVAVTETVHPGGQRLALDLLRSRVVAGAVVLGAAVFLMIGAFDALWDVVHEDLDTPTLMANLGITLFAIPLVVLGPTGGRLAQRVGPFRIAGVGLLVGAAFMYSYGQLPTGSWIFTFSMAHAITDGLTVAASGVAIAMAVPENRQAGAQGVMGAAQALAAGITAILVGGIYEQSGRGAAYTAAAVGMVALVVVGMVLALPFIRGQRPKPSEHPPASTTPPTSPVPSR
jgi:AAHS family 4-hydroxybenzoate transporter-like MFS transporter